MNLRKLLTLIALRVMMLTLSRLSCVLCNVSLLVSFTLVYNLEQNDMPDLSVVLNNLNKSPTWAVVDHERYYFALYSSLDQLGLLHLRLRLPFGHM